MCPAFAQLRGLVPGIQSCGRDKQQPRGQREEKQVVPKELLGLQSACLLQQRWMLAKTFVLTSVISSLAGAKKAATAINPQPYFSSVFLNKG